MEEVVPPEHQTAIQPPTAASEFRPTRRFLFAFYALAVIWGVRSIRSGEPSGLDLLVPVALAYCLGWWTIADARRRRHPIPLLAQPWFFMLAGLVVPAYVVWSRRGRGVGWLLLHAALWYVLATAVMYAGALIHF